MVNAYGPTTQKLMDNPVVRDRFYEELISTVIHHPDSKSLYVETLTLTWDRAHLKIRRL